ncbi:M48 family metallopeptidase [Gloeothece verrucosa]|uniref:Peptidase M48 domain-containing protein n=1 Tax=Gloeothece verrucosa (strain PCC 7822) TaxID=497965 RepID=E0U929_GLOV7|nr:M48 family metalloprotease [Gloeothece verrucosa]ADN16168.1 conserved hypothetical protein [Gloeothece verrucosa PCC 7822]
MENEENSLKKPSDSHLIPENTQINSEKADNSTTNPEENPSKRQWRNAEGAASKRKMKPPSKIRLWGIMLATPIAVFWVFYWTLKWLMNLVNFISVKIQNLGNRELINIYEISPISAGIFLIILGIIAPFLLEAILKYTYHPSPFSLSKLAEKSPLSGKLLQQYAQKRSIPLPSLKLLSTSYPVVLTYGNHPRNTCIVISEGLLNQLTNEEIATIYGTQLGHLINKDVILMSALAALLQLPYCLYSCSARAANQVKLPILPQILGFLSTVCYGIYQFWRLPALWLSRQRMIDSDHGSIQLTQNPNALCRALLKISIGISQNIEQQGYIPPLLDSFSFLLPLEPRQVMSLGSLAANIPYESVLHWDCTNPYRHWLSLLDSHPLLGERLYLLGRYAKFWNLDTELELNEYRPSWQTKSELWGKLAKSYQALPILAAAFLYALGFGVILRILFWLIGKYSHQLDLKSLSWLDTAYPVLNAWGVWLWIIGIIIGIFLFSDHHPHIFAGVIFLKIFMSLIQYWSRGRLIWFDSIDPLFNACCLIILSFSLIIWLNRYFPDPKKTPLLTDPSVADLLSDSEAVPAQAKLVRISGILLGYPKINQWLGQELILQTTTGLIKLKFMGLIGNIIPWYLYPKPLIKKPVTVQGWFRRGSIPVIEIETLKPIRGKTLRSGATHFIFLLIVISALWGTHLIRTH